MARKFASSTDVNNLRKILMMKPVDVTIPVQDLADESGLSIRVVRDAIAQLIVSCALPIIADRVGGGYIISTSVEKIEAEAAKLTSQSDSIQLRRDGLLRAKLKVQQFLHGDVLELNTNSGSS